VTRLAEVLKSQLAEVGVGVEVRVQAHAPSSVLDDSARNVIAMVWIERSHDALVIHFYEPAGSSLKERYIPVSGDDATSIEEIAVVVRSAVSALRERTRAPARVRTPEPESKPAPPAPAPPTMPKVRPASSSVQLSIAYLLTHYASGTDWDHGPSLAATWHAGRLPLAAGLGYAWLPEVRRTTDDLTVTLERHPLEAFVATSVTLSDGRLRLEPQLGVVLDPITRTTTQASDAVEVTPSTTRWSWAASTKFCVSYSPLPRFWVFGSGGADTLLNRFENVVQGGDTERTVLSPLRVRPHFQLGSAIEL
jgi:hypothetical protein